MTIRTWLRAALAAGVILSTPFPASAAPPLTVFLVRHAEKETNVADPPLTKAGRERAEDLAGVLADAGLTAIFTSEYERTRETAAPIAKRSGLTPTVVPAKDLDTLLSKVRALPPGARVLIVGHSDTVPALAHRLTGADVADLTDAQYDRLFVGTVGKDGHGEVLVLHYGAVETRDAAPR
jgi:broad specificity phosphatase PhoE